MMVYHCLLYDMQPALVFAVFHGNQLFAMHRANKGYAGIEIPVRQGISRSFCDNGSAGATVSGCAAFLGPEKVTVLTQEFENGEIGVLRIYLDLLIIQ